MTKQEPFKASLKFEAQVDGEKIELTVEGEGETSADAIKAATDKIPTRPES